MTPLSWQREWLPLAQRFADLPAVVDRAGTTTYAELFDRAAGVAAALGAGGERVVATIVPNGRHAVAASCGVALAGLAEAPVNPALAPEEIAHCLSLAGASTVLATRESAERLPPAAPDVLLVEDLPPAPLATLPPVEVAPDAWTRILFTSGTTGRPKGIVHTHGGRFLANLLQRASLPVAPAPGRSILLVTPFAHGASLLTQAVLDGGGAVRLLPGIDDGEVAAILRAGAVNEMFAPPTVLRRILDALGDGRIAGIDTVFCGTAPLAPDLYARARETFGPVVRIAYGKTEVVNPITVLSPAETDRHYAGPAASEAACVGWPASGVEVRVETDGMPDERGRTIGPVLVRARHMLAATLTERGVVPHPPDAFHRTGDLGFLDGEGRLHLAGREADVIKTGGYRFTPEEIENRLRPALPGADVAVLGLASDYWGEVILLAVADGPAGWRDRLAPALDALTPFKRPRLFADVPEIPRNALGKVVRARLRETILATHVFEDGRRPTLAPRPEAADPG